MENMNNYKNEINLNSNCPMMYCQTCLSCFQKRYISNEYEDSLNFRTVPVEEIEE